MKLSPLPSPPQSPRLNHGADALVKDASVKPRPGADALVKAANVMPSHGADAPAKAASAKRSQKLGVDVPDKDASAHHSLKLRLKPGVDALDKVAARPSALLRLLPRRSRSQRPRLMLRRLSSRDVTWLAGLASRPRDSREILPRPLPRPHPILLRTWSPSTLRPVRVSSDFLLSIPSPPG